MVKWPKADASFDREGHPVLASNEVVYRRYSIGRRFWGRATIRAVITNRRFGISEVSGWFRRKERWTEVPVQSVRGVDVGYGSVSWLGLGVSALVAALGVLLLAIGLRAGALSSLSAIDDVYGLFLLVPGLIGISIYVRRQFLFRLFVEEARPTIGVGLLESSRQSIVGDYLSQLGGYSLILGGPGPDTLPFLKEVGGVVQQIREAPGRPPQIGLEFAPGARGSSVDFARLKNTLEAQKHPDLAENEHVYRRYHVGRRSLGNADVWAVFTSRRVGLFEEKGWFLRTYRWNEISNDELNGVDVGVGPRHWVSLGFFALWTIGAGVLVASAWTGLFGHYASVRFGFALLGLGGIDGLVAPVLLLLAGLGGLFASARRQFIFSVFGAPTSNTAVVASSRWAATTGGRHLRAGPGRDVFPFLLHCGALLQELRANRDALPQTGIDFQPLAASAEVTPAREAAVQRKAIVAQLEQDHCPQLAQGESVYRLYEVGRGFWGRTRVYAVVTNRRVGLLSRRGWLGTWYFWTENDISSVLGVDFAYRYKEVFLATFRTQGASYQLTVSAGATPRTSFFSSKPGTEAMEFLQQIGALLIDARRAPATLSRLGRDYAPPVTSPAPAPFLDVGAPSSPGGLSSRTTYRDPSPQGAVASAGSPAYQLPASLVYDASGRPIPPPSPSAPESVVSNSPAPNPQNRRPPPSAP